MLKNWLYRKLKRSVGIFFNILNLCMAGNLPPFGCVCIVVEDQDRYLVIERPEGGCVFPGGFMRWRENPQQAAQREFEEETGLHMKVKGLIGCSSNTSNKLTRMSTLTVIYSAEVVGGEMKRSIEGQPCWLDILQLQKQLYSQQRGVLDYFLLYREEHGQPS